MRTLVEMENSGLLVMLRDDSVSDLGRMYSLLRRVEGGLPLIRGMMAETIKEQGKQLVNVRMHDRTACAIHKLFAFLWNHGSKCLGAACKCVNHAMMVTCVVLLMLGGPWLAV